MLLLAQANYRYMRLFLSSFFLYLLIVFNTAFGEALQKEYNVKVSGLKIGKLKWKVEINEEEYLNEINLKSEGVLSALYRFEGKYFSKGFIQDKELHPTNYSHFWKTNKTSKNMNLAFKDGKLLSLKQTPVEEERLRINVFNINKNKDPLTSFLQLINGKKSSLVVDGRRVYKMNAIFDNKTNQTVVQISDYFNLWADHKRSNFEKIIFEKINDSLLPIKINIYFDGRVFKLEKI